ncbi:hypothetical protein BDV12DRAFT_123100 [Aspergillus spectabilis]
MSKPRHRACDACFVQKIRCQFRRRPNPALDGSEIPCRQCHSLEIPCTYERRAERTGRQARHKSIARRDGPSSSSVNSTSSSPPSPIVSAISCSPPRPTNPFIAPPWATFTLCSTRTLEMMLQNYFRILYTLTPIVDQTSLQSYFSETHTRSIPEPDKFSLVLSLCAYYTTVFPRRFDESQTHDPTFQSRSCREFLHGCEAFILSKRPVEYFRISTHDKCVTAYFLALSSGLVGLADKAYSYLCEMKYHIQRLGYHSLSGYGGLDEVQSELAKRMYWLYVVAVIHEHVGLDEQKTDWEPFPPEKLFNQRDFPFLYSMPTTAVLNTAADTDLVSTALRYLAKIYLTFVDPHAIHPKSVYSISDTMDPLYSSRMGDRIRPGSTVYDTMQSRLDHALDGAAPCLGQDSSPFTSPVRTSLEHDDHRRSSRVGAICVNLQVTRIWAKSIIFERSVIARRATGCFSAEDEVETWQTRIGIGEELLAFFDSADSPSFEINAPSITSKIRRIAARLLLSDAIPNIDIPADVTMRVTDVLHRILVFLADLNRFSMQDTQFSEGIERKLSHP